MQTEYGDWWMHGTYCYFELSIFDFEECSRMKLGGDISEDLPSASPPPPPN
mgnify:CR=1 FL=1